MARFPFLGETVKVVLDPGHVPRGALLVTASDGAGHTLQVALPHTALPTRNMVQAWLMRQAKLQAAQLHPC